MVTPALAQTTDVLASDIPASLENVAFIASVAETTEASYIAAELTQPALTITAGEIKASRFELDASTETMTSVDNSHLLIRYADEFAELTETSRTVAELAEPARTKTAGARNLAAASDDTSSLTLSTEGTQAAYEQTHAAQEGGSLEPRLDSQAKHRRLAVTDVAQTSPQANVDYRVGNSAVQVTPPTFTSTAGQTLVRKLEYCKDSAANCGSLSTNTNYWKPLTSSNTVSDFIFWSDELYVCAIDWVPNTLAFKVYCDAAEQLHFSDITVYFRYSAQISGQANAYATQNTNFFSIRVWALCHGVSLAGGTLGTLPQKKIYYGAKLVITDILQSMTVYPSVSALDHDCYFTASFEIAKPDGTIVDSSDAFYGKLITSASGPSRPAAGAVCTAATCLASSMTLVADTTTFVDDAVADGTFYKAKAPDYQVNVWIKYTLSNGYAYPSKPFTVIVKPRSGLIAFYRSQATQYMISRDAGSARGNQFYAVDDTNNVANDLSITATSFTVSDLPNSALPNLSYVYDNIDFPAVWTGIVQKKLEYLNPADSTWYIFSDPAEQGKVWSTGGDTTCISALDGDLQITVHCSDYTKFSSQTIQLRYSYQWTNDYTDPAAPTVTYANSDYICYDGANCDVFQLTVQRKCWQMTLNMDYVSDQTIFSGATRDLGTILGGTTSNNGDVGTVCFITAAFHVTSDNPNGNPTWKDKDDTTLFSKIVDTKSGPATATSVTSTIKLVADTATFDATGSTVWIRITYTLPQQENGYTSIFMVTILPKSQLISLYKANTSNRLAQTGSNSNLEYIVDDTELVITHTTFTPSAFPDGDLYGNTGVPQYGVQKFLEYATTTDDGATWSGWSTFSSADAGKAFSTDGATRTCVSSAPDGSLDFKVKCLEADAGDFSYKRMKFRYYAQWFDDFTDPANPAATGSYVWTGSNQNEFEILVRTTCYGASLYMNQLGAYTIYSGATLTLTGAQSATFYGGVLNLSLGSSCFISADFAWADAAIEAYQEGTTAVNENIAGANTNWLKVFDAAGTTGPATNADTASNIKMIPETATFDNKATGNSKSITIRVRYWLRQQAVPYIRQFKVTVLPLKDLIDLCKSQIGTIITKTDPTPTAVDTEYVVGATAKAITSPTFSASTAPTDSSYGNTALPACDAATFLMISYNSAGSWTPWTPFVYQDGGGSDVDGKLFSTNGDKTCVSAFTNSLEITISCADADASFFSDKHVRFRYTMLFKDDYYTDAGGVGVVRTPSAGEDWFWAFNGVNYSEFDVWVHTTCFDLSLTMGSAVSNQKIFVGAKLDLGTNLFSDTAVSGGSLNATCSINAAFYVTEAATIDENTIWKGDTDTTLFSKIFDTKSGPATSTAKNSGILLKADSTTFTDSKSTTDSRRVITVKVAYNLPQQSPVSSTFQVEVQPRSVLVQICADNTAALLSMSGTKSDLLYNTGDTAVVYDTPPSYTPTLPDTSKINSVLSTTVNLHGNTDIPLCTYTKRLQYLDGSTWTSFDGDVVGPLFTTGAGNCISTHDNAALTFTIHCASTNTSKSVKLRYSAMWDTFGDQPATESLIQNVNSNVFTITVMDMAFCNALAGWSDAVAYVDSADLRETDTYDFVLPFQYGDVYFDALDVKHDATADGNDASPTNPAEQSCGTWTHWVYLWDDTKKDWNKDDETDLWYAFFDGQDNDDPNLAIYPDDDYFTEYTRVQVRVQYVLNESGRTDGLNEVNEYFIFNVWPYCALSKSWIEDDDSNSGTYNAYTNWDDGVRSYSVSIPNPIITTELTDGTVESPSQDFCNWDSKVSIWSDATQDWSIDEGSDLWNAFFCNGIGNQQTSPFDVDLRICPDSDYFLNEYGPQVVKIQRMYVMRGNLEIDGSNIVYQYYTVNVYPYPWYQECSKMSLSFIDDFYSTFYYDMFDDWWYDGWYDFDYDADCNDGGDGSTCPNTEQFSCREKDTKVELISYDAEWWYYYYDDVIDTCGSGWCIGAPGAYEFDGMDSTSITVKLTLYLTNHPSYEISKTVSFQFNNYCKNSVDFEPYNQQGAVYYQDNNYYDDYSTGYVDGMSWYDDNYDCGFDSSLSFRWSLEDEWCELDPDECWPYWLDDADWDGTLYIYTGCWDYDAVADECNDFTDMVTPGDHTAVTYVQRSIFNPYSNEKWVQEFPIYFVRSLDCYDRTVSLYDSGQDDFSTNIGEYLEIDSRINWDDNGLTTGDQEDGWCYFTSQCQVFYNKTGNWVNFDDIDDVYPGLYCQDDGTIEVDIDPYTDFEYWDFVTYLQLRVVYDIPDSQVPLWESPSRQAIYETALTVFNPWNPNNSTSRYSMPDITYYVGYSSESEYYCPEWNDGFANHQTAFFYIRPDGEGHFWSTWEWYQYNSDPDEFEGRWYDPFWDQNWYFIQDFEIHYDEGDGQWYDGDDGEWIGCFEIYSGNNWDLYPNKKFNAKIVLTDDVTGEINQVSFNINFVHVCSINEIYQDTVQENIHYLVNDDDGYDVWWTDVYNNDIDGYYDNQVDDGTCPLYRTLYIKMPDNTWLQMDDESSYDYNDAANYCDYDICLWWMGEYENTNSDNEELDAGWAFWFGLEEQNYYNDIGPMYNIFGSTYTLKMVTYATDSLSRYNIVEDEFTITFDWECYQDVMCIADDENADCLTSSYGVSRTDSDSDRYYVAGDNYGWIRRSGLSDQGCPIDTLAQVWDEWNHEWTGISEIVPMGTNSNRAIIKKNDGHLEVYADDDHANNFCLSQTYLMRVTYTSWQSSSDLRSVYDEFTVTIAAYDDQKLTLRSEEVKQMIYEVYPNDNVMWYNPIWWYDWTPVFDLDNIDHESAYSQCPIVCKLQVRDPENDAAWLDFNEWQSIEGWNEGEFTFWTAEDGAERPCTLKIDITENTDWWYTTTLRMRVGPQYAALADGQNWMWSEFDLSIRHFCNTDQIYLLSYLEDIYQTIYPDQDDNNAFYKYQGETDYFHTIDGCEDYSSRFLQIYIDEPKIWVDYQYMDLALGAGATANYVPFIDDYDTIDADFYLWWSNDNNAMSWEGKTVKMRVVTCDWKSYEDLGCAFDYFQATFHYRCVDDEILIEINDDIWTQTYYMTGDPQDVPTPVIYHNVDYTDMCAMTYSLQAFFQTDNMWQNYTHSSNPLSSWVSDFNGNTGDMEITFDGDPSGNPGNSPITDLPWLNITNVTMRIIADSVYSNTEKRHVMDDFLLYLKQVCYDAELIQGDDIEDYTYYINSGDSDIIAPDFTNLDIDGTTECAVDYRLHWWVNSTHTWVLHTDAHYPFAHWDNTTGQLFINTNNFAQYDMTKWLGRITVSSIRQNYTDEFTITLMDMCRVIELDFPLVLKYQPGTLNERIPDEVEPFYWDMWQLTHAWWQPLTWTETPTACPITYAVTNIDANKTPVDPRILVVDLNNTNAFEVTGVFRKQQDTFYYVHARITNVNGDVVVVYEEANYWVSVTNPCTYEGQILVSPIDDIDYWIHAEAATSTFAFYDDWTTVTYGNVDRSSTYPSFSTGNHLCGPKTYRLYTKYNGDMLFGAEIHNPTKQPWISFNYVDTDHNQQYDSVRITVQTDLPKYYTNEWFTYWVYVTLDNYSVLNPIADVAWVPVQIRLKNCQILDFDFPVQEPRQYNIYTPVIYINMTHFDQVVDESSSGAFKHGNENGHGWCYYTVYYTATWKNFYNTVLPLPNFVAWKQDDDNEIFRFEVQSNNTMDLSGIVLPTDNYTAATRQTYTLQLTATVSVNDMDPPIVRTTEVWLDVNNYCLQDQMTIVTDIDDYIYYINENTEYGVWDDNTPPRPKIMHWYPQWYQSVDGCPLRQHIYRMNWQTGQRYELFEGMYERGPLVEYSFPLIPVWQLYWQVTKHVQLFDENHDGDHRYTAHLVLTTDNYWDYDMGEDNGSWDLLVVLESEQSVHANREGIVTFNLQLRDVCWDLPTTSIDILGNDPTHYLLFTNTIPHGYLKMISPWRDYCGGSTYTLEYLAGTKLDMMPNTDPSEIDINQFYVDNNQDNIYELKPNFFGAYNHADWKDWEGVHQVQIRAQEGIVPAARRLYRQFTSPFTLTLVNPCRDFFVVARDLILMRTPVGSLDPAVQPYDEFTDEISNIFGDGYNICGPRIHYLRWNNFEVAVDETSTDVPFINIVTTRALGGVVAYEIQVQTSDYNMIGTHTVELHVGLADYPTAYEAVVPITVMIDPCIVTEFNAPSDVFVQAVIGKPMNYYFNFDQQPCLYTQTLSAQLSNGQPLPSFITSLTDQGLINTYTVSALDVGQYEIVVTSTLSNYNIFTDENSPIDPAMKLDPTNLPDTFIYTTQFMITLSVEQSVEEVVQTVLTPFFVPEPTDYWFFSGDSFEHSFGTAYGSKGHIIVVTRDFGDANFIDWDAKTNTMSVAAGATDPSMVGEYSCVIRLTDTSVQTTTDTNYQTYTFKVTIYQKIGDSTAPTDQEVKMGEVFMEFEDSVLDMRGFNFTDIEANAVDITELGSSASSEGSTVNKTSSSTLPRIQQNQNGAIGTVMNSSQTTSVATGPPVPFVSSVDAAGNLKIGFTNPIIPPSLDALNDKEVAMRMNQASNSSQSRDFLTPDGYRQFNIKPAVEVKILPTAENPVPPQFTYRIVSIKPNDMNIKLTFANPAAVSSGVSSDRISITFWDTSLLVGADGSRVKEGSSISKTVLPQLDPKDNDSQIFQGKLVGWLIAGIIVFCLLFAPLLNINQLPFWQFFFLWQMFTHTNLLQSKMPAFATVYWQQMLNIWTVRNSGVTDIMNGLITEAQPYKSYSQLLNAGGFSSLHIIVNLGFILWIPCLIIVLMPFAWFLDSFCSMPDERLRQYGGRKPLTKRPMLEVLTNMLARYALMSVLDIFICIFISLSASSRGAFSSTDRLTNLIVSWILVGLFSLFVLMIIVSTIWRKVEVAKASNAFDVPVNRWFKNLYDGFRANHPEKFGIVMLMFIFRLVVYAAVVVFLAENPVMQMFALIISSLMYNMTVAKLTPYYNFHDRFLHYFNESSFCTFMILSLAYTPFVTDLAVRKSVAWGQINFLHAVFFVNFVVLVTVIVNASRDLFKYSTKVKPDQPPAHGQTEDKVETRADTVKTEGDVLVIPEGQQEPIEVKVETRADTVKTEGDVLVISKGKQNGPTDPDSQLNTVRTRENSQSIIAAQEPRSFFGRISDFFRKLFGSETQSTQLHEAHDEQVQYIDTEEKPLNLQESTPIRADFDGQLQFRRKPASQLETEEKPVTQRMNLKPIVQSEQVVSSSRAQPEMNVEKVDDFDKNFTGIAQYAANRAAHYYIATDSEGISNYNPDAVSEASKAKYYEGVYEHSNEEHEIKKFESQPGEPSLRVESENSAIQVSAGEKSNRSQALTEKDEVQNEVNQSVRADVRVDQSFSRADPSQPRINPSILRANQSKVDQSQSARQGDQPLAQSVQEPAKSKDLDDQGSVGSVEKHQVLDDGVSSHREEHKFMDQSIGSARKSQRGNEGQPRLSTERNLYGDRSRPNLTEAHELDKDLNASQVYQARQVTQQAHQHEAVSDDGVESIKEDSLE